MGLIGNLFRALGLRKTDGEQLLQTFLAEQQNLQESFFRLASESGKPRGLRWSGCDWLCTYALVHDAKSKMFTLFCGVNLSFEAIEGGDMEDVEAVSTIRDGCAVFHNQGGRWGTGGRVLFNMNPETAAQVAAVGQQLILLQPAATPG